jgi:hypothetical protein
MYMAICHETDYYVLYCTGGTTAGDTKPGTECRTEVVFGSGIWIGNDIMELCFLPFMHAFILVYRGLDAGSLTISNYSCHVGSAASPSS